jgi:hypothetical protein
LWHSYRKWATCALLSIRYNVLHTWRFSCGL